MSDLLLHVELRLTNGQCRLWVNSSHGGCNLRGPLYGPEPGIIESPLNREILTHRHADACYRCNNPMLVIPVERLLWT
jgi:hypothetical protein